MRVLAVGNLYPPQSFGGYEIVWRAAMEHLRAAGHEVRVLTTDTVVRPGEPDDPGVHRELGWYLRDLEFPRLAPRELVALERRNARVLERHLAAHRPEVVSWWGMGGMSLSLLERVRRAGLESVAFVHDDWLTYGPEVDGWLRSFGGRRRALGPAAERLTGVPWRVDLPRAARYVFVSEAMRRAGEVALGGAALDAGVAHSGIDAAFLDPAPERPWGWELLYAGRIDARKGIDTAVDALAHLPAAARLTVAGSWDEREERRLAGRAAALGAGDRLAFVGQLSRDELHARYGAADAVVFPVRWEEPWGLVPLEAMARGRPVVATGRGGSAEYLRDGENCLLFGADDPAALAAALERLAVDPELRTRLRSGGLATAPRHTEARFNAAVERELLAR